MSRPVSELGGAKSSMNAAVGDALVAGDPVLCDLPVHPSAGPGARKHRNEALAFEWWQTP